MSVNTIELTSHVSCALDSRNVRSIGETEQLNKGEELTGQGSNGGKLRVLEVFEMSKT